MSKRDPALLRTFERCEKCDGTPVEFDTRTRVEPFWIAFVCRSPKCGHKWKERASTSGVGNATFRAFCDAKVGRKNPYPGGD